MSTQIRAHDPRARRATWLILAGLAALFAACVESQDRTVIDQTAGGVAGESGAAGTSGDDGNAGGSLGGASGSVAGTGGAGTAGAGGGAGTRINGACVLGSMDEYCARLEDGRCASRSEMRDMRDLQESWSIERPCQGADGSSRVVLHINHMYWWQTYIYDAAGVLVTFGDGGWEPDTYFCGGSYGGYYGDASGDCIRQATDRTGCPNPGAVPFRCVLTDAGTGG